MIKLNTIKVNPANPRLIKDHNFKKLCDNIKSLPKMMALRPIVTDDNGIIMGGNMRFKALIELGYKEVPNEWVKPASAFTEAELRQFSILDNVGFGEWDWEMLANDWQQEQLLEWGLEIPDFNSENNTNIELYTKKIEAPIYKPENEKPDINSLIDKSKTQQLISEIESTNVSEPEKEFLRVAALRHTVFNFSKIADYYAHSNQVVQDLMEKSGLVIIDFNKAIEYGFVKLSEQIAQLYGEEYET
jgi:hypothetical protein